MSRDESSADLVLTGGAVSTMDAVRRTVAAVAVRAGRIVAVGSARDIATIVAPRTRRIDLAGQTLLRSVQDARVHPAMAGIESGQMPAPRATSAAGSLSGRDPGVRRRQPAGEELIDGDDKMDPPHGDPSPARFAVHPRQKTRSSSSGCRAAVGSHRPARRKSRCSRSRAASSAVRIARSLASRTASRSWSGSEPMRAEPRSTRRAVLTHSPSRRVRSWPAPCLDRGSRIPARGRRRDDSGMVKWITVRMMSDGPSRLRACAEIT